VSVVAAVINFGVLSAGTKFIAPPGSISPEQWLNVVNAFAVAISLLWNFFGYKFFVFKR
jgi:hypothetical protein